jgi:hypothetical protein
MGGASVEARSATAEAIPINQLAKMMGFAKGSPHPTIYDRQFIWAGLSEIASAMKELARALDEQAKRC